MQLQRAAEAESRERDGPLIMHGISEFTQNSLLSISELNCPDFCCNDNNSIGIIEMLATFYNANYYQK